LNEPGDSVESRSRVEKLVKQLVELAGDETACRVLGVDGAVAEQLDISFLVDPVDYMAYDLAAALIATDDEADSPDEVPPLVAALVAEVKLGLALLGRLDQDELVRRTLNNLRE
jgi:hypothetical protein